MAGARRFPFFHPPGCPRPECHRLPLDPDQVVYFRLYRTKGYPGGVPLFSCLRGRHTFSLRRYSVEFYLHRPHKTAATIDRLVSSCSLRQAARAGRKALSRSSVERRLERFGLHSHRLLRRALRERLRLGGEFQLDEAESFERDRRMAPLTIPVLVHRETRYTAALSVATLAPRVKAGDRRFHPRPAAKLLPRRNRSNRAVSRCLSALVRVARPGSVLSTDRKPSYAMLLRRMDPGGSISHVVHSSRLPRTSANPLFPVNHLLAMARDGLSRLRRRTWCASKKRRRLWLHLGLYFAWKNFVRPRFNEDRKTAAQFAGVTRRRWRMRDLVRWRLDLGALSISPWESALPAAAR